MIGILRLTLLLSILNMGCQTCKPEQTAENGYYIRHWLLLAGFKCAEEISAEIYATVETYTLKRYVTMLDYNGTKQLVNFIYAQGNVSSDLVLVLEREVQNLTVYHGITENRFNRNTKI